MNDANTLDEMLIGHRDFLFRCIERQGGGVLRHESVSDLVQGVYVLVLRKAEQFDYRGEGEFRSWLRQIVRNHLVSRHRYWKARKRDAGKLLRITSSDASRPGTNVANPVLSATSPSSYAARKEAFLLATQAVTLLLPRDQQLVRWLAEELSLAEVASRLGVSKSTAGRAQRRAIERFEVAFRRLYAGPDPI